MEEDKIKLDVNFTNSSPQTKEKGNFIKSFLGFLKDMGPIIIGVVAIFYAYQQTKETNDTNYNAKVYEITFEDKKKAYVDFMQSVYDYDKIEYPLLRMVDTSSTLYKQEMVYEYNYQIKKTALSIHLDVFETQLFNNYCDSFRVGLYGNINTLIPEFDNDTIRYEKEGITMFRNSIIDSMNERQAKKRMAIRYFQYKLKTLLFPENENKEEPKKYFIY